jgi:hypothetical protein
MDHEELGCWKNSRGKLHVWVTLKGKSPGPKNGCKNKRHKKKA